MSLSLGGGGDEEERRSRGEEVVMSGGGGGGGMETLALVGGSNQEGRDTLSEASNSWEVVMSRLEEVGLYRMVGEGEVWWALLGSNLCEMEVGLCRRHSSGSGHLAKLCLVPSQAGGLSESWETG